MFVAYFMMTLLLLVSMFLIFIVLLQRGRGGGLAGALGGMGGQSAFGTKAGDLFTTITIVTTCVWVVLACLAGWRLRVESVTFAGRAGAEPPVSAAKEDAGKDGKDGKDGEGDL